jgi:(E)-4-hydroxy-3-methylbut-2-enyl-diphosphate synthase
MGSPRRNTRQVLIGNVNVGGDAPIRIQSMTTTNTCDVDASIAQTLSLIASGSELVRLTAPSIKDADALELIAQGVRHAGHSTPLVADIHFTPNAASRAAEFVEKIRVNPGNFADKKKFDHHEYTDETYALELERIKVKFTPLVLKCKSLGRAMRIGTNHGSLSDRITSRFGDTPLGMVESALEFIRICIDNDYHELVISMKSSNTRVMVQAYRMLVYRMGVEDMCYPLHLGVTEAGDGEDGRIKSAVGIGALLEDGIGDTIRVSLTESPEAELPVARDLVDHFEANYSKLLPHRILTDVDLIYSRREVYEIGIIGGSQVPVVIHSLREGSEITVANLVAAGYRYSVPDDKWNIADQACDFIFAGTREVKFPLPGTLRVLINGSLWDESQIRHFPIWSIDEWSDVVRRQTHSASTHFVNLECSQVEEFIKLPRLARDKVVVILSSDKTTKTSDYRQAVNLLDSSGYSYPVIFRNRLDGIGTDKFTLYQSTDLGGLFLDGMGDGIWVESDVVSLAKRNSVGFGILQATRTRISKTEYISCPSCGRTLFDLEETTAKIRSATSHLKGLKIGVMGCIVNGPGEMADADFGYVGTGPGKITLYRERNVVRKNVPEAEAIEALVDLIKSEGYWVEPSID